MPPPPPTCVDDCPGTTDCVIVESAEDPCCSRTNYLDCMEVVLGTAACSDEQECSVFCENSGTTTCGDRNPIRDCIGDFGDWGPCLQHGSDPPAVMTCTEFEDVALIPNYEQRTYSITQPAANGGQPCPYEEGYVQDRQCARDPCPIDCQLDSSRPWGDGWQPACETGSACSPVLQTRRPEIIREPSNGGAACPGEETNVCIYAGTCSRDCTAVREPVDGVCSRSCAGRRRVAVHELTQRAQGDGNRFGTADGDCSQEAVRCFDKLTQADCDGWQSSSEGLNGECVWDPDALAPEGACNFIEYEVCSVGDSQLNCEAPTVHRLTLAVDIEQLDDTFDSTFKAEIAGTVTRYFENADMPYELSPERVVVHSKLSGSVVVIFSFTNPAGPYAYELPTNEDIEDALANVCNCRSSIRNTVLVACMFCENSCDPVQNSQTLTACVCMYFLL